MEKKLRKKIYQQALKGVKSKSYDYTCNGLCYALKVACQDLNIPWYKTNQLNIYGCYKSKLIEYSLFFNSKHAAYLRTDWEIKEIILELCIAMCE